ncbi:MAG: tRNA pseudouridine(13) synthase TruD [Gammaproteobacteria bacterium]|nr:tRNA pseudouridine(13) synthase TruD [Gammaproteobacteria bacterium]
MKKSKANSPTHHNGICADERARLRTGADLMGLPRAFGPSPVRGALRSRPTDFIVDEQLAFPLSGEGEHLYLRLRKSGQNTRWVARELARRLGLPPKAIGFAGLKDRHAVTSQWFSVHLPGRPDPASDDVAIDGVELVEAVRHTGKLRTGALSGNRFRLVIRDLTGDREELRERLVALRSHPVPNYFGAQRFGRDARNLDLLAVPASQPDRDARSFALSALRSALFNMWLATRIDEHSWRTPMRGEIVWRPAAGRYLHVAKVEGQEEVFPTGLLCGAGDNQATEDALRAEREFFGAFPDTCDVLAAFDTRTMRRPLCLLIGELEFECRQAELELAFSLARGQFATTAIRELGDFFDAG